MKKRPGYQIGQEVESITGMKGRVEGSRTMAGDRSPGYYVRWENGSRSFARIGTTLKYPEARS